jgi:hypothetical protein
MVFDFLLTSVGTIRRATIAQNYSQQLDSERCIDRQLEANIHNGTGFSARIGWYRLSSPLNKINIELLMLSKYDSN